ncbi:unnamed protein product [Euphydryas editha]|uniref:Uncharacterized protein n=1 Tax=Euphydryas editha TaxID=104508 RepID=A0AAU9TLH7_EUPED|nr:unnamed protein product [Euphydryas editha]
MKPKAKIYRIKSYQFNSVTRGVGVGEGEPLGWRARSVAVVSGRDAARPWRRGRRRRLAHCRPGRGRRAPLASHRSGPAHAPGRRPPSERIDQQDSRLR